MHAFDIPENYDQHMRDNFLSKNQSMLNANAKLRDAFLRKVYGLVTFQLSLTIIISGAVMYSPTTQYIFS